jgi:hypothetical protein
MKKLNSWTAPTIGALALVLALKVHPCEAQGDSTFVIAGASGYGVEDCLTEAGECGKAVADAWCEAHGRGVALRFGQEAKAALSSTDSRPPYFITCGQ